MSSDFSKKIEQLSNTEVVYALMSDMFRSYCRLVRRHATQHYAAPVQRAMLHIDSNLSEPLSLKLLAELQGIHPSYLSTLFKKETGQTMTDYINQQRIEHSCSLLRGSQLQIQTIAQHCGIPDVNYFSKLFRKYRGMPPKEYRAAQQKLIP